MASQLKSINTFVDSVKNKLNKKTDNKTITHNKSCMASTTLIEVCIFVGKFIDFFFLYSGKKTFFSHIRIRLSFLHQNGVVEMDERINT